MSGACSFQFGCAFVAFPVIQALRHAREATARLSWSVHLFDGVVESVFWDHRPLEFVIKMIKQVNSLQHL